MTGAPREIRAARSLLSSAAIPESGTQVRVASRYAAIRRHGTRSSLERTFETWPDFGTSADLGLGVVTSSRSSLSPGLVDRDPEGVILIRLVRTSDVE
jgi:hypothetical protein